MTDTLTRTHYITVTETLTRDWSLLTPTGSTSPSVIGEHGLAYDSSRDVLVLYGGNDGTTYFDDLWQYEAEA